MNSASQDVDLPSLAASGTYTLLIEGSVGAPEAAFYSFTAQLLPPDNVPAPATTNTWVGPAGGDWNVAANWSKGAVPIATDNVYIGLPTGHAVVVTSGTVTVNSLTCEGDLTLSGGAMMNLNGVSKVKGSLVLAGGTLGGTGALTVVDRLNVTAASTLSGARALITQGVSLITSRLNFHGTWFNQGTLTLSDSGRIVFGAHSGGTNTLVNAAGAMLNLDGSDGEPLAYSSGTAIISNAGRLSHSASGTHSISSGINFHNTGQVTVLAGTLSINGSGRDNGAYNVASDGTCNFGGGTRTLGGFMPVIVEGTGALQVTGGTTYLNSVIVFGSGNFNVAGGTLAGSGTITSNMTLSSGTVGGTGGTLTTAGTSVVTGGISFSGGQTWVNAGVLTVSGGGYINFGANGGGSNTLVNAAGATLNLNSSSSDPLTYYSGTAIINNAGTLNHTVSGAHSISNGIIFNNTGAVNVTAGALSINGSGSDTGTYSVDAGANCNFGGGTRTISAASTVTISATGAVQITGGTTSVNGTVTGTGSFNVAGGTLAGTGVIGSNMTLSNGTVGGTGTLTTTGKSVVSGGVNFSGGKTWLNQGTLTVSGSGYIYFGYASGGTNTLVNAAGATLNLNSSYSDPLAYYTGTAILANAGTLNQSASGSHSISGSIGFNNTGTVNVAAGTLVYGSNLSNQGSVSIAPGARMNVSGAFSNGASATVRVGLGNATTIGVLAVSGTASLNGTLNVYLGGGYVPTPGDIFNVITYASRSGAFGSLLGESPDAQVTFTVDATSDPRVLKVRNIAVTAVAPGADLVVTGLRLADGIALRSGDSATVVWNDRNSGTLETASSWTDRLVVRRVDNGEVLADIRVPYDAAAAGALAAGSSLLRQATFVLPKGNRGAGNLSFTVTADVDNSVAEINVQGLAENNNTASVNLTSALAPYPDLIVTDVTPVPSTAWRAGDAVTVNWKTRNQGDGATVGSWTETLRVRNLTTGQTLLTRDLPYDAAVLGDLAAGGESARSTSFTWPAGPSAEGHFEFAVTTDTAGQVFENNAANTAESNNAAALSVVSAPDLKVLNLASDALAPRSGDLITLNWDDLNGGNVPASGGWYDRIKV
ncbi:MAG TPA: CARDB domain-containing protein, partial [Piscinibacter sp.]|nr:CARDB domain-containing protein [Piscinibacter sp.]